MEKKITCADKRVIEETKKITEKYDTKKDNLIAILNEIQQKMGYIPKASQIVVSEYLNIPLAEVYGVITFYSRFTLIPKGENNISVCMGTACFVKGSKELLERAKERLGLEEGQTSEDGKFSLDTMRCVGACGLAPVFTVNDEVYGKATVQLLDQVLDKLMNE